MKHIFVVNPHAGPSSSAERIKSLVKESGLANYEIYQTKKALDATEFVRSRCEAEPDETLRFYACGGDGTLNEVSAGAGGFENAQVACYPCGSGNDFVKYYGEAEDFTIERLNGGHVEKIDLLSVNGRRGINACHFGFDSFVAEKMSKLRRKAIIGGKNSYTTSVAIGLFRAMKNDYTVEVDGEILNPRGKMLLCTIANGGYVGGGYNCAPRSDNADGYLEVCFVNPISIPTFLKLMGSYRKGKHLDDPRFDKHIKYRRAKSVRVTCPKPMPVSIDGEVVHFSDFTVTVEPGAVNFVVPQGLSANRLEAAKQG